jgi:hypothetical protein
MSKKFVVVLNGAPHFRDLITEHFTAAGCRVWHWYADLWLLSEVPDELTAGALYQEIEQAVPTMIFSTLIVLEMGPELRYYGRAPKAEAWDWMRQYWGTPDFPKPIAQAKQPTSAPDGTKAEN